MAISQILIPILTAHIWQTRCGRSTPPHRMAISQILIPILTAHIWLQVWQIYPHPIEWQFHRFDSYSDSSYLADQVWQIYPHAIEWQFHRFWFLFWQLIFGRPGVADLPPVEQQFHRFWFLFWQLIFGNQVWQIYPHAIEWQFHRFWFLFWQLIFGRPGVADLPPPNRMAISQILIPILTAHIWLTRCGRSTPAISQILIPILTAHIRQPGVADLPPSHFSQILIPILTAHIWQTRCGRSTPTPCRMQFHRFWFLFWQCIFGQPGVADLPPPCRTAISQILIPILTAHIWPTRCDRSTPTP